jgi:RNA polymerase sigma-70 factor (ECF subfamily)
MSSENDEEIIILYKNGDQKAFRDLVERYTLPLYNFTTRIANQNDAPDIVQEIFIKVWKNITHFDSSKASFKTWIFTIAKNTITDFLRKKRSLLFSDLYRDDEENTDSFEENIPDEKPLPLEAIQRLQDREFLNNVLKKMSLEENEILTLHYQEEMTFSEISQILNKSLNTVKSKHRRTLTKLRKMLDR